MASKSSKGLSVVCVLLKNNFNTILHRKLIIIYKTNSCINHENNTLTCRIALRYTKHKFLKYKY